MKHLTSLLFITILLLSCKETTQERMERMIEEWNGKTILFPQSMPLTSYRSDTILTKHDRGEYSYTILNYVDTIGCVSCKLQLQRWKKIIEEIDTVFSQKVNVLMVFHPKEKKRFIQHLRNEQFDNFVYMDENDSLNTLNNFVHEDHFSTFLLDKNNKILVIGNPIFNPNIKKLYYGIISEGTGLSVTQKEYLTTAHLSKNNIDLGDFSWSEEQQTEVVIVNAGDGFLVINDVITSCGCTTVDYPKEPIRPGEEKSLIIKYKADNPEHFSKMITIYCNAKGSPFQLKVSGNAK